MAENEYREKESIDEETREKPSNKRSKTKKEGKSASKGSLAGLTNRIDAKKVKTVLGSLLILVSFYTFLACLSYLFTWAQDQDQVLDKSLWNYLLENEEKQKIKKGVKYIMTTTKKK
jgi:hypothetical protein